MPQKWNAVTAPEPTDQLLTPNSIRKLLCAHHNEGETRNYPIRTTCCAWRKSTNDNVAATENSKLNGLSAATPAASCASPTVKPHVKCWSLDTNMQSWSQRSHSNTCKSATCIYSLWSSNEGSSFLATIKAIQGHTITDSLQLVRILLRISLRWC